MNLFNIRDLVSKLKSDNEVQVLFDDVCINSIQLYRDKDYCHVEYNKVCVMEGNGDKTYQDIDTHRDLKKLDEMKGISLGLNMAL